MTVDGRWFVVLVCVALVCVALISQGLVLHGGDLSVQLGLAVALERPELFYGDLYGMLGVQHPGLGRHVHRLFIGLSEKRLAVALGLVHVGLLIAAVAAFTTLCGRLVPVRSRGLVAAFFLCLPQPVAAWARLLEPQPIHRMMATPLVWAGLAMLLGNRWILGGCLLGIAIDLHPATGVQAFLVGLALSGWRAPRVGVVGLFCAAPVLVEWVQADRPPFWVSDAWEALLRLRLGHHLDPRTWPPALWALPLGHGGLALWGWIGLSPGPMRTGLGRALGVSGVLWLVGCVALPLRASVLVQGHLLYVELLWVGLGIPLAARRGAPGLLGILGVWLLSVGLAGRELIPNFSFTAQETAVEPWADPWVRVVQARPTPLTIKDGGEVIVGPEVATIWAEQLVGRCGPRVLDPAQPAEDWRGWVRLNRRCRRYLAEKSGGEWLLEPTSECPPNEWEPTTCLPESAPAPQ